MNPAPRPKFSLRPSIFWRHLSALRRSSPVARRSSRAKPRKLRLQSRTTSNQVPVNLRPQVQQLVDAHWGEFGSCLAWHGTSPFARTLKPLSRMRGSKHQKSTCARRCGREADSKMHVVECALTSVQVGPKKERRRLPLLSAHPRGNVRLRRAYSRSK